MSFDERYPQTILKGSNQLFEKMMIILRMIYL